MALFTQYNYCGDLWGTDISDPRRLTTTEWGSDACLLVYRCKTHRETRYDCRL